MRAVCAPKCLEKDAHADFLCLHCYPNAVGDNTWAYFFNEGQSPQVQLHKLLRKIIVLGKCGLKNQLVVEVVVKC